VAPHTVQTKARRRLIASRLAPLLYPAIVTPVHRLLKGLIDYAGLFPPAGLGMTSAVNNYASYRTSADSWALARFIITASRHFVVRRRPALEEESLDLVQRVRSQFLEDAQPERLRDRRVHAIEHRVRPAALHPFRAAVREQPSPCLREFHAGPHFGALQPPRQRDIAKCHTDRAYRKAHN